MQTSESRQNEQQQQTQLQSSSPKQSSLVDGVRDTQSLIQNQHQASANSSVRAMQLQAFSKMMAKSQSALQLKANTAALLSATNSASPIQLATITGSGGTVKTFNETTTNSVSYAIGDKADKAGGTPTGTAEWKDVLIDAGTNNAATQLHLVNMDWGGKGGSGDGNIFPGSQSLNGHHKTQENKFRRLFSAPGDKAPVAMTYTCSTSGPVPNYTFPAGPAAPDVPLADHTVNVSVRDDTNGLSLLNENVAAGKDMKIRDPK